MKRSVSDLSEPFETWLLRRIAEAAENGKVSADLVTDLHAGMAEVRAGPLEARDALTLMDLAERVHLPVDHLTELLVTLQAQPPAARARFLRRFVEAWLMQQREAYDADRPGANDG